MPDTTDLTRDSHPGALLAGPGGDRLGAVAFSVGEERFTWEDVILAAVRRGDWAQVETAARYGLACRARADDEARPAAGREVGDAAAAFRYARGLVTADAMRAWLAAWGLTAGEWMDWIDRDVLRRRWAGSAALTAGRYPVEAGDVAAVVWSEAVCSGALTRFAAELAGLAAAAARELPAAGASAAPGAPEDGADAVAAEAMQQGLGSLASPPCRARLARLARIDRLAAAYRAAALTPDAVDEAVREHLLDWTRLCLRTASFAREPAAREALCCVREDARALTEVAAAAGAAVEEGWVLLGDTEPGLREELLGAEPGALLGPRPVTDRFLLVEVVDRRTPTPDDPATRSRATRAALDRLLAGVTSRLVTWERPR